MARAKTSRFPTPVAALRFYFRASEFLADGRKPGLYCKERHPETCAQRNALCDFLALDTCFIGMNDFQLWLMKELYGPDCFGWPRRTVTSVSEAARLKFPDQPVTRRMVAQSKNEALQRVVKQLKREQLI